MYAVISIFATHAAILILAAIFRDCASCCLVPRSVFQLAPDSGGSNERRQSFDAEFNILNALTSARVCAAIALESNLACQCASSVRNLLSQRVKKHKNTSIARRLPSHCHLLPCHKNSLKVYMGCLLSISGKRSSYYCFNPRYVTNKPVLSSKTQSIF